MLRVMATTNSELLDKVTEHILKEMTRTKVASSLLQLAEAYAYLSAPGQAHGSQISVKPN
jgi:hypothetical protein